MCSRGRWAYVSRRLAYRAGADPDGVRGWGGGGGVGRDLLESLVLGYEVAHRAQWNEGRSRLDGIEAAAGRMLRLPEKAWGHAIQLSDQLGPLLYPGLDNFYSDANHICNGMIARCRRDTSRHQPCGRVL